MLRFDREFEGGETVAQIGGDQPSEMIKAARRCLQAGYGEINVNLGCPSRNAQAGRHGAMLMKPDARDHTVALLRKMGEAVDAPISVKLRIGVDDDDSYETFRHFVSRLHREGGVRRFVVHSRKALLGGLDKDTFVTTRQNRLDEIVPLRYDYAYRLKAEMPHLTIEINGGIDSFEKMREHLVRGVDGVMIGRYARDDPFFISKVDSTLFGDEDRFDLPPLDARSFVIRKYASYACKEQRAGFASREMLLKPLNRIFEGMAEKQLFADTVRSSRDRSTLLADDLLRALDVIHDAKDINRDSAVACADKRPRRDKIGVVERKGKRTFAGRAKRRQRQARPRGRVLGGAAV